MGNIVVDFTGDNGLTRWLSKDRFVTPWRTAPLTYSGCTASCRDLKAVRKQDELPAFTLARVPQCIVAKKTYLPRVR